MTIGVYVTGAETANIKLFQISVSRHVVRLEPPLDPSAVDYVFHLPSQFSITRFLPLTQMAEVLATHPHLVQIALRITGQPVTGTACWDHGRPYLQWVEQRRVSFRSPALFPAHLLKAGWPDCPEAEAGLEEILLADPQAACGIWGRRADRPWATSHRPVVDLKSKLL